MYRIVLLLTLLYTTLFGYEYDKLLLKAQSNIFPKLVLLDKDIANKVKNGEIIFCIVHHPSDVLKSKNIKTMIEQKFGKTLDQYKLKVITKKFDEVKEDDRINAYYILQGPLSEMKKISDIAKKKRVPTFAYDPFYFDADILISMTIQNNSVLYLNKKVHKAYKIDFVDIFYQLVRFYDDL